MKSPAVGQFITAVDQEAVCSEALGRPIPFSHCTSELETEPQRGDQSGTIRMIGTLFVNGN